MDAFEWAFAGLLVVYAPIAFRENDRFEMMAIDNYQFPFDDFAQQVQRARQQMDDARRGVLVDHWDTCTCEPT